MTGEGDPYAENGILGPWSATSAGDHMLEIGFKPQQSKTVVYKEDNYLRFNRARNYTIEFILREMRRLYPDRNITVDDLEIDVPEHLPILWIRIEQFFYGMRCSSAHRSIHG